MKKSRIFWICLIGILLLITVHSLAAVLGLLGALVHAIVKPLIVITRFVMIHPLLSVFLFGAIAWLVVSFRSRKVTRSRGGDGPKAEDPGSADAFKRRFHRKMRGLARDLDRSLSKLDQNLKKRGY